MRCLWIEPAGCARRQIQNIRMQARFETCLLRRADENDFPPVSECAQWRPGIIRPQINGKRLASAGVRPEPKSLIVVVGRPLEHDEAAVRQRLRRPAILQQQRRFPAERRNRIDPRGPFQKRSKNKREPSRAQEMFVNGAVRGIVRQDSPTLALRTSAAGLHDGNLSLAVDQGEQREYLAVGR